VTSVASSGVAFLHYLAAFSLTAALTLELVLLRLPLTVATGRRILAADLVTGIAAVVVLAAGLLRVFYFEKGADYYSHSAPFIAKMVLFALVFAFSIAPTLEFLSWRKVLKAGQTPVVAEAKVRLVRRLIHFELLGVVLIILAATLMAHGIGYFG
jgi:putative membrane protein